MGKIKRYKKVKRRVHVESQPEQEDEGDSYLNSSGKESNDGGSTNSSVSQKSERRKDDEAPLTQGRHCSVSAAVKAKRESMSMAHNIKVVPAEGKLPPEQISLAPAGAANHEFFESEACPETILRSLPAPALDREPSDTGLELPKSHKQATGTSEPGGVVVAMEGSEKLQAPIEGGFTFREVKSSSQDDEAIGGAMGAMAEEGEGAEDDLGKGGLWFKIERMVVFLQLLALMLEVPVVTWPPFFRKCWSFTHFSLSFMRAPVLWLIGYCGEKFDVTLPNGRQLLHYESIIGYMVELLWACAAAFVIFFLLQMPDYTSKAQRLEWERQFIHSWFLRSFVPMLFRLCLLLTCCYGLVTYGSLFFPEGVGDAAGLISFASLVLVWALLVVLSFVVRTALVEATKRDAEFSFMITIKSVVKAKIKGALFFLSISYVPLTASIIKALIPLYDWNDTWTTRDRRHNNHHTWCHFMGFPPVVEGSVTYPVLECTSLSGISMLTFSAWMLLLFAWGLPKMVRYLINLLNSSLLGNEDIIKSFGQARYEDRYWVAHLELVEPYPRKAVWLERRLCDARECLAWLRWQSFRKLQRAPFLACYMDYQALVARVKVSELCSEPNHLSMTFISMSSSIWLQLLPLPLLPPQIPKQGWSHRGAVSSSCIELDLLGKQKQQLEQEMGEGTEERSAVTSFRRYSCFNWCICYLQLQCSCAMAYHKNLHYRHQGFLLQNLALALVLTPASQEEADTYGLCRIEYAMALENFQSDHVLEITCWESVLDTSGLVCLVESYSWLHTGWKLVHFAEEGLFIACLMGLGERMHIEVQLLGCAGVLLFFAAKTAKAQPFLYFREACLDMALRCSLISIALLGAAAHTHTFHEQAIEILLGIVTASTVFFGLKLGNFFAFLTHVADASRALLDAAVANVLFKQIDARTLALEPGHAGIQLLMQWDDLLTDQRWSAFMGWPQPRPSNLLGFPEKLFTVKWAALRGIGIQQARTSTTLTLLHDAMIQAEVEPARWMVKNYPALLKAETVNKESPVYLAVMETASMLLDLGRESTPELEWKASRMMELLLSPELQACKIRWNVHQYDLLTEHGEQDLAELAQHVAESFNLRPPKGYEQIDRWRKCDVKVRDYLAEAMCASHGALELHGSGLGDHGHSTLVALSRALQLLSTTYTRPSIFRLHFPQRIKRIDLSSNRMHGPAAKLIAQVLKVNTTVEYLDLSRNGFDGKMAAHILASCNKNMVLITLKLGSNQIGPEVAESLAGMIKVNRVMKMLDLSDNFMGEKKFWEDAHTCSSKPSAGPPIGDALALNRGLTDLNLARNQLGGTTGSMFAASVRRHPRLTSLDLSGNLILSKEGQALAMAFTGSKFISHLNLSSNFLGPKVGKLFAAALKRNKTLTYLDLAENELGTKAGAAILKALIKNNALHTIVLRRNGLGPLASKALSQLLLTNSVVISVDLSDNMMGISSAEGGDKAEGGTVLGVGIKGSTSIQALNLANNGYEAEEVMNLSRALIDHPSLTSLDMTGQSKKMHGATAISRSACNTTHLLELNLSGNQIGGETAGEISKMLSTEGLGLQKLSMSGCDLTEKVCAKISIPTSTLQRCCLSGMLLLGLCTVSRFIGGWLVCRALGSNRSITWLDLSETGLRERAGMALANSMRELFQAGKLVRPCLVRYLNISSNDIGNDAAKALIGSLINAVTEHLDLASTGISQDAGMMIGRMLRHKTLVLGYLNLENNALGRVGANDLFWALRRNRSITSLDLSSNTLGPLFGTAADELEEYGTAISSALSLNQTIQSLDLGSNAISAECGVSLTDSVRNNKSLSCLQLEHNSLDDDAAAKIGLKLHLDKQLSFVNLSSNNIGWQGGLDLAQALCHNKRLLHLDLSHNHLGDTGSHISVGEEFASALMKNASLTLLDLEENRLGPHAGKAIAKALQRNCTLINLNMRNNRLDQSVGCEFEAMLRKNVTLQVLETSPEEVGLDSTQVIGSALKDREAALVLG
ncbi:unnamed protein product [Chrysoparadoxa australica]